MIYLRKPRNSSIKIGNRVPRISHTNATLMLKENVPAKIVSTMLGHSSIGITLDTYSHVLTDMQKPAINAINDILKNIY